jgi:hypothetical protein
METETATAAPKAWFPALAVRLVGVALLAWWLHEPAARMVGQTVGLLAGRLVAAPGAWAQRLATPGAGEGILPSQVEECLALLRAHDVTTYALVGALAEEPLFTQRLVEAAWPARPAPAAAWELHRGGDGWLPAPGEVVARRGDHALVRRR